MRELRLKYIIQMVSDIGAKAKSDAQALTQAQKMVDDALKKTQGEAGAIERVLLRLGGVAGKSAQAQAAYLSKLALRYQDVRKAAEGAFNAMTAAAKVGAGAAAAGYAADRMTRAPMEYSLRLAHMANTAYSDRDAAGRIAGKQTLNAAITAAMRTGGGKRDDVASALDYVIASGALDVGQAIKALPMIARSATASGAAPLEMAGIGIRAVQNFRIPVADLPKAYAMGMAAGQAGGFELKDMARWLPEQMAMAGNLGMSGMGGFAKLVAWNQASVLTAGSKDAAGNNLRDLLMELNTPHFKGFLAQQYLNDGAKLKAGERKDQLKNIDQLFLDYQARGVDKVDATVDIMEKIFARNKGYAALKAKLGDTANTDDRRQIIEAMAAQMEGSEVGKVFHNQQSLMAFLGLMNNRDYVSKTLGRVQNDTGAIDTAFGVIGAESEVARQRAINEAAVATQNAFEKVAPAVNGVFDGAASLAQQFPGLTTSVMVATGALGIFTAALGTSGLFGLLTGRAGNAGGLVGTAATMTAGAVANGLASPFRMTNAGSWVRKLSGTFGPMLGFGVDAWGVAHDETLTDAGKRRGYAGAAAGGLGGWGGAAAGAALGTMLLPGIGTAVGGLVGGIGGYMAGKGALNWLWGQDPSRDFVQSAGGPGGLGGSRIELGQGKVEVQVRLTDERANVTSTVLEQPSFLTLSSGATNPAGYLGVGR